ncbi:hypothetical protein ACLB2K_042669 [Fragaria x ananassa]
MAPVALFISFLLTSLAVPHSAEEEKINRRCPPNLCTAQIGNLSFPFKHKEGPSECGLFPVDCSKRDARIQLKEGGHWHEITSISESNNIWNISVIINKELQQRLKCIPCVEDEIFEWSSLPSPSPISNVSTPYNQTLLNCSNTLDITSYFDLKLGCNNASHPHYYISSDNYIASRSPSCSVVHPSILTGLDLSIQPGSVLTAKFILQVTVSEQCYDCYNREGICQAHEGEFEPYCFIPKGRNLLLTLGLGIGLGVPTLLAACLFILWRYRQKGASLNFVLSRNTPNSDLEERGIYLGVPVFTYKELEEATNHFDCDKEIGDGGFGIVYHGKLKDSREVAVKRLYEHNYRRAEHFMNEIEILTHLHHKNLVTLYGCTSRHSRDLLLVYEYIANGTVADHLHGDRAATGLLTWPIRMSIAKETASALCYLHASDIVHRDVKTTNILLDNNFTVKVADFGISRLFPLDATHVSTAPQGTPGYVDPEYHQCYQLTPKSDVYSFGVVLIELISSLPAVDITRQREEINLSNIAINRIQNGLYSELVDSCLGFESDPEVKRMTIAVADLAFQCLQQDSDARPTMCEVLEALKKTESRNDVPRDLNPAFCDAGMRKSIQPPPSPYSDRNELLKNTKAQSSPNSVIGKWTSSSSTTPNVIA